MRRHADTPMRRHADTPIRRHADTPTRRHADTPTRRPADSLILASPSGRASGGIREAATRPGGRS
ncbi:hypothetical protein C6946_29900 [Burkholderia thailandensis]|nr:hypothetical protein C6946_29900 [Burkholderia thailandensis]